MRKILAVDIDGTLVNSKKFLSNKTKDSLIKAQEKGHIVVIVSGRHPKGVEQYAKALNFDYYGSLIASFNGGLIKNFKTGEVLVDRKIEQTLLEDYLKFSKNLPVHKLIYISDSIYTDSENSEIAKLTAKLNGMRHIYKKNLLDRIDFSLNDVVLCHENPEILNDAEDRIRKVFDKKLNIVRSTKNYLEAIPKRINKGASLKEIANYFNLGTKDIIAFGDELNDIEMIREAGIGVAMGNANPIIKDLADYVTLTNDEDGIAHYLEKFNII